MRGRHGRRARGGAAERGGGRERVGEQGRGGRWHRKVWDLRAPVYEALLPATALYGFRRVSYPEAVRRCVERVLPLGPGGQALDVATGTGLAARCLSGRLGRGGRVVAVDFAAGMLREAARRSATPTGPAAGPCGAAGPGIRFVQADAHQLPFAADAFTGVTCTGAFNNFPDPARALREMRRVLEPGGRMVLLVALRGAGVHDLTGRVLRRAYRWAGLPLRLFDPLELVRLARGAGFDAVCVEQISDAWGVVVGCRKPERRP